MEILVSICNMCFICTDTALKLPNLDFLLIRLGMVGDAGKLFM